MPTIDELISGDKRPDPEQRRRDLLVVALKRAIDATFNESSWRELGLLTNSSAVLENHARLFRSLHWGDPDYEACVIEVLPDVLGKDFENEQVVTEFVELEPWLRDHDPKLHATLFGGASLDLQPDDLAALTDSTTIQVHLGRIQSAVATDPEHAIGAAKELIESTAKLVLTELGEEFDDKADVPTLVKQAQTALGLHPSALAPSAKGVETTKKMLGALSGVAIGVAELRNLYGTGHGKASRTSGLGPRHARLAVDAASTYCRALLATLADPDAPWRGRSI